MKIVNDYMSKTTIEVFHIDDKKELTNYEKYSLPDFDADYSRSIISIYNDNDLRFYLKFGLNDVYKITKDVYIDIVNQHGCGGEDGNYYFIKTLLPTDDFAIKYSNFEKIKDKLFLLAFVDKDDLDCHFLNMNIRCKNLTVLLTEFLTLSYKFLAVYAEENDKKTLSDYLARRFALNCCNIEIRQSLISKSVSLADDDYYNKCLNLFNERHI